MCKMVAKNVMLRFSSSCVGEPVISNLIREQDIEVNILNARIHPTEEGRMLAQLIGSSPSISSALEYLSLSGVEVHLPDSSFIWQETKCVHCGACAGICPSGAFSVSGETFEVEFDISKCILCELCIEACFYSAIQSVEDYIEASEVGK